MDVERLAGNAPRLDQPLGAIKEHDEGMAEVQRRRRAWPERVTTLSPVLAGVPKEADQL